VKTIIHTLFFFLLVTQICFAQGTWTKIGDMPEIRLCHSADEINGKIYIVGVETLNRELTYYNVDLRFIKWFLDTRYFTEQYLQKFSYEFVSLTAIYMSSEALFNCWHYE